MRMVRLSELKSGAGKLTAWRLAASAQDAARATGPGGLPTHNQELRLRQADAEVASRGDWSRRWHLSAFQLPGPIDSAALERAFAGFVRRHDTLRSGFERGEPIQRYVLPASEVRLDRTELGRFDDEDEALSALVALADVGTNPWGWPACVFASLSRAQDTTVLMAADHLHVDVHSHLVAVHEIHRLYEAGSADSTSALAPPGSHASFAADERARDSDPVDTAMEHWLAFARAAGDRLPPFPLDLGVPADAAVQLTQEHLPLFDERSTAAMEVWCWENGGMFLSALLAAAAMTVVGLGGSRDFRTIIPVQTRPDPKTPSVGWYVNGAPIAFTVPPGASLDEVMRAAHASFLEVRRHRHVPVERIQQLLPPQIDQGQASWFSYLDLRAIPGGDWDTHKQARVTSCARRGSSGDVWVNRTPEGTVLTARYPDAAAARSVMHAYADGIARRLLNVIGDRRV